MNYPLSIAIADDFPAFIKGLKFILENVDTYSVDIEASSGIEILEKISKAQKLPDICLLDISMPGMNGFDTLVEIKQKWKSIKVIMQSMYFDEYNAIKAFRGGASAFIKKEAMPEEIVAVISNVVEHGYYYSTWIEQHVLPSLHDDKLITTITEREKEFLTHICTELTYAQIAELLGKSTRTIEAYRDGLFEKLQIKNRTGLAIFALKTGIASIS